MRASLAGVVLFALACAPGPTHDPAADQQAIRDLDARFNEFLASANDSGIAALYDSNATLMPPNLPAVTGARTIGGFFAQIWPLKAKLVLTPVDISVSGDIAVDRGTWTWNEPNPAGGEIHDTGKYLVTWRRTATGWKIVNDSWNSDNPPPAPPPGTP